MDEREIRSLIDDVEIGRLSRRRFVQTMVGLGLTAPLAAQMLTASGAASSNKAMGSTMGGAWKCADRSPTFV